MKLNADNFVEYSEELWFLLTSVNKSINKIRYETDLSRYKRLDYWTQNIVEAGSGDCDDYALSKRKALMEAGVPWQALSPAICLVKGEGHAVLIVRTTKGHFVLDNNNKQVQPWEGYAVMGIKYEWISWLDPVTREWIKF